MTNIEKAFNSISMKFILSSLELFGFDPSIRKWVSTFYKNITAYILQNRRLSKEDVGKGIFFHHIYVHYIY